MKESNSQKQLRKRGLGRGLANLLASTTEQVQENIAGAYNAQVQSLTLDRIRPNEKQPREKFDAEALQTLAESIKAYGVIQPILVAPIPGSSRYSIIAGERRFRASKLAGQASIPVQIYTKELDHSNTMVLALIENIQRADLSPIEEAKAYQWLLETHGISQDELAKRVGKERSSIANTLRLLKLHPSVLKALDDGSLSVGHAKVICGVPFEHQLVVLSDVQKKHLSVRSLEEWIDRYKPVSGVKKQSLKRENKSKMDPQYDRLRQHAEERLNARVLIKQTGAQKGKLVIHYHDLKILGQVLELIGKK